MQILRFAQNDRPNRPSSVHRQSSVPNLQLRCGVAVCEGSPLLAQSPRKREELSDLDQPRHPVT